MSASPSDNPDFVRFVQLALNDPEMGAFVRGLHAAPVADRNKLLSRAAAEMRARKVPENLVKIVESLQDAALLEKLLDVMGQQETR